jgi:hypothetical protein
MQVLEYIRNGCDLKGHRRKYFYVHMAFCKSTKILHRIIIIIITCHYLFVISQSLSVSLITFLE